MVRNAYRGRATVVTLVLLGLGLIMLGLAWGHGAPGTDAGRSGEEARPTASGTPRLPTPPISPSSSPSQQAAESPHRDAAAGAVLPASHPVRVEIPGIDVRTSLMELGLAPDGSAEVPPPAEADHAGWYRYSPTPGEVGPAVVIGHVDSVQGPAVFYRLGELSAGDPVRVAREDGSTATFTVDAVETFAKDSFPTERVYGDIDHAGLRLITCGGDYDDGAGGYQANTVVFASLVTD